MVQFMCVIHLQIHFWLMLSILFYFHYTSLWHHETSHKHNTQSCINIFKWICWTTNLICLELKSVPHAVWCEEGMSTVAVHQWKYFGLAVKNKRVPPPTLPHPRNAATQTDNFRFFIYNSDLTMVCALSIEKHLLRRTTNWGYCSGSHGRSQEEAWWLFYKCLAKS